MACNAQNYDFENIVMACDAQNYDFENIVKNLALNGSSLNGSSYRDRFKPPIQLVRCVLLIVEVTCINHDQVLLTALETLAIISWIVVTPTANASPTSRKDSWSIYHGNMNNCFLVILFRNHLAIDYRQANVKCYSILCYKFEDWHEHVSKTVRP